MKDFHARPGSGCLSLGAGHSWHHCFIDYLVGLREQHRHNFFPKLLQFATCVAVCCTAVDVRSWHLATVRHVAMMVAIGGKADIEVKGLRFRF